MFRFDRSRARCSMAAVLAGAMLGACALPQRSTPASQRPPTQVTINAPPPAPASATTGSAPVPPASSPAAAPAASAPTAVASPVRRRRRSSSRPCRRRPFRPAVAARFPEPALSFATPAFEPGRSAFTSNAELRTIVHGLERERPRRAGDTDRGARAWHVAARRADRGAAVHPPPAASAVAGAAAPQAADRAAARPASTATSPPAPKRCSSSRRSSPQGRLARAARPHQRHRPAARQPRRRSGVPARHRRRHRRRTATTCCCRRPRRRRRPGCWCASPRRWSSSTLHEYPVGGRFSRSSAACSASTRCCSTRPTANLPRVRDQGGRGVVPPAAGRRVCAAPA